MNSELFQNTLRITGVDPSMLRCRIWEFHRTGRLAIYKFQTRADKLMGWKIERLYHRIGSHTDKRRIRYIPIPKEIIRKIKIRLKTDIQWEEDLFTDAMLLDRGAESSTLEKIQ
jgi:hypothetical protein